MPSTRRPTPDPDLVQRLRARVRQMESGGLRETMPVHPALAGLVQLHPGSSYRADATSLAVALLAGPSEQGTWTAVVGVDDLGLEAAADLGLDLGRTLLVPDPGEHWAEVTAALLDVTGVLLLRPPGRVDAHTASRIAARLRKRSTTLVVQGDWPQCDAHLSLVRQQWQGLGQGTGHLSARRAEVVVRHGAGPTVRGLVTLPGNEAPRLLSRSGPLQGQPAPALREVG
ncbi:hypothetical protein [Nocardioides alcanivorans]|uniref:hypothetical protein n=1 Tax=Nocardioides alcanivorans TaxID=2897352 RepID=UPI001F3895DB|nr:hypothetical protein [Nocardioides alcanivorans]